MWNYDPGDSVRVSGFTNLDEAELFINGKSLGRKSSAEATDNGITWDVTYEPGELLLKGYKNGAVVSTHSLKTAGKVSAIKAIADRDSLSVIGKQLVHVEINLVDQNGLPVFGADDEVTVALEGPATLLGLESGSLVSHEDYKSNKRKAYHGKLLAYIQSQEKEGIIEIRLSSPGLKDQVLKVPVK